MDIHNSLPEDSRIIIFQSTRNFTGEEISGLETMLENFLEGWNTHGDALTADYALPYDRFIVIAVDEHQAATSGCSLDSLTRLIKEIDNKYQFGLMGQTLVSYNVDGVITTLPLMEFKKKVKNDEIPANANIFHNGVRNLQEFEENWEMPLEESWVKDLIKSSAN